MPPKRLVLCTEGHGDVGSVPALVGRLLNERFPDHGSYLFVDANPIRLGGVERITGRPDLREEWINKLGVASNRGNLGGVLLILDGDPKNFEHRPFCAADAAHTLGERARQVRAGERYSLAVVFACMEYESWLIAGIESLAGKPVDSRSGVKHGTAAPTFDIEGRRNAKGWLGEQMVNGYNPPTDQLPLTRLVDLAVIRSKNLRSFGRLEHALSELTEAIRTGKHCVTPQRSVRVPPA